MEQQLKLKKLTQVIHHRTRVESIDYPHFLSQDGTIHLCGNVEISGEYLPDEHSKPDQHELSYWAGYIAGQKATRENHPHSRYPESLNKLLLTDWEGNPLNCDKNNTILLAYEIGKKESSKP